MTGIFQIYRKEPVSGTADFEWECFGTGFFVSKWGVFLTAWHVVEDQLHLQRGKGLVCCPVVDNTAFECHIVDLQRCGSSDIAIGLAVPPPSAKEAGFGISLVYLSQNQISAGSRVVTFGYPRSVVDDGEEKGTVVLDLLPDHYDGEITAFHPNGLGICKWPVYEHNVSLAGGISGGPLIDFNSKAAVGVNCTGIGEYDENGKWGTATDIREALDVKLATPHVKLYGRTLREVLAEEKGLR